MKKKYKAVFFDWDGTAVLSRKAPVEEIVGEQWRTSSGPEGKSGDCKRNYNRKYCRGKLETYFTKEQLAQLYLGLGRGAFNYRYENGQELIFSDMLSQTKNAGGYSQNLL